MQQIIIAVMNQFGYLGIVVLIAVENIFPPIPSEVILTFGGFMTTYTSLSVWGMIISATLGSTIGAIVLYYIGRLLSSDKLNQMLNGRIGKMLHFDKEEVGYTMHWFEKKGRYSVLFCRCIPVLRSLISIPAGMSGMRLSFFLVMTLLGSLVWNIVLVHLGSLAGSSWDIIASGLSSYAEITKIVLVIAATCVIMILYFRKKHRINN